MRFIDLDEEICKSENSTVPEIFLRHSESYFREKESIILQEISNENAAAVIAAGGGTPCYHNGISYMNEKGATFFLDCSIGSLMERLKGESGDRPLLQGNPGSELEKILIERYPVYCKAQHRVNADEDPHKVAGLIISVIKHSMQ